MRRDPGKLCVALVAVCAALAAGTAEAGAEVRLGPCGDTNDFACGHLAVPLDPSGATPGSIELAIRRHRAPVGDARSAVVALAGGPGQPALPFAQQFAELLGPILATRDEIVFDQRGVGLSQALRCRALEGRRRARSVDAAVQACASQLGAVRRFYATSDSVADIEALRSAGGYDKLVLYGTSYGTKVAEAYARAYPAHVEALVLDSVVPPDGPDPLARSTFSAIPGVLRGLCGARACAGVTRDPVADLGRVVRAIVRRPLHAHFIDGSGRRHAIVIYSDELLGTLLGGDFSPVLRPDLITAVRAAADGDTTPLARLLAEDGGGEEPESQGFDLPLYLATSCEDEQLPFSRAAGASARIRQAAAAARVLPPGTFAPFTAANALDLSDVRPCAHWPFATPAPPPPDTAALPRVPALIISGAQDLRTPSSDARALAARLPGAQLLVVPRVGHSVLGGVGGTCAQAAVQAMFAGHRVLPCPPDAVPPLPRPPSLPPLRLAAVSPSAGTPGLSGRTLHAVELTLEDFGQQLTLALLDPRSAEGAFEVPPVRTGGLRAGRARLAGGTLTLHGYTYVPGVAVSGTLSASQAHLRVGGWAGAGGSLALGAGGELVGNLGGHPVRLPATPGARTAIVGFDAQARSHLAAGGPPVRARAPGVADGLDGLGGLG